MEFLEILTDWSAYIVSSLVFGALILAIMSKRSRQSTSEPPAGTSTSRCSSPSCARCHGEEEIKGKLLRRLEEHVIQDFGVKAEEVSTHLSQHYARLLATIESHDRKDEILSAIYRESGHPDVQTRYLAHVWMMPGLKRDPLWTASTNTAMENLFSLFEDPANFEAILEECRSVSELKGTWKENHLPSGSWKTYFLMNQGTWDEEKSSHCPQTRRLLESCGCLMEGVVYGNVLFSVLRRGSAIEPHTSPCNFRLRCHLALNASAGFSLRVGKLTASWETGRLLVFDDSFVHSVAHRGDLGQEVEDRVVLIFDIWHPEITHSEQKALKYIFE
jgi:hypothetical protein